MVEVERAERLAERLLADEFPRRWAHVTKSSAGVREVGVPGVIVPDLQTHLRRWSERGPHGRVFIGPRGGKLLRSNYSRYWKEAVDNAGLGHLDLHFHDLRHTANSFVASSASLRELMTRMGHASPRAALIYQHANREREREITEALSRRIEAVQSGDLARQWHEADPEHRANGAEDQVGAEGVEPPTSAL
jgi:integrase